MKICDIFTNSKAQLSLQFFLVGAFFSLVSIILPIIFKYLTVFLLIGILLIYSIICNVIIACFYNKQVNVIALNIGLVFSLGISFISIAHHNLNNLDVQLYKNSNVSNGIKSLYFLPFGIYLIFLSLFHFTEYFVPAHINPNQVDGSSFLINHSAAYTFAASSSWLEYFVEAYMFSKYKFQPIGIVIGCAMCITGEYLRKLSMYTAGRNFNHQIQENLDQGHQLIRHGIYRLFRHPSYLGWFIWCLGTQVILLNPLCFVGYLIASWLFFNQRIQEEEYQLIKFFGLSYLDYKSRTFSGIPFISGYLPDTHELGTANAIHIKNS